MLVSISPGRATRPDETKASDSHARSSQIWYENALKTSSQVLGRVGFSSTFYYFDFFSVCTSVFFFFDHADCSTCFLLAKNGIVIVTRHLPSAAFLDQFLRSRPGQLPQLKETFLHGHSILMIGF